MMQTVLLDPKISYGEDVIVNPQQHAYVNLKKVISNVQLGDLPENGAQDYICQGKMIGCKLDHKGKRVVGGFPLPSLRAVK